MYHYRERWDAMLTHIFCSYHSVEDENPDVSWKCIEAAANTVPKKVSVVASIVNL